MSFLNDKLKLASTDGGICCRLLTSVQLSEGCFIHEIPVKDEGSL